MKSLLAKLEAATEGSRELDWAVADHLGEIPKHTVRTLGFDYDWYRRPDDFFLWKANDSEGRNVSSWSPREYTTNVDSAMTLVPEGYDWRVGSYDGGKTFGAVVTTPEIAAKSWITGSYALMPALALCIAALRTRGETE